MAFLLTYSYTKVNDGYSGETVLYPLVICYRDNFQIRKRVITDKKYTNPTSCLRAGRKVCEEERLSLFSRNIPNMGKVTIKEEKVIRLDRYRSNATKHYRKTMTCAHY